MNYDLTLKGHVENDHGQGHGQGYDLIEKVMWHISRSVSSCWTQLRCFHRFSWSLSKVIAEKLPVIFHDLKWPWGHEKGSQGSFFHSGCELYLKLDVWVYFEWISSKNRSFSVFSHWLSRWWCPGLSRSAYPPSPGRPLKWSLFLFNKCCCCFCCRWIINKICLTLGHRFPNWDINSIDTVTCIHRWKFQGNRWVGVAMTIIQTFYEVRSLDVTWWPVLVWPGSENLHNICGKHVWWGVPRTAGLAIWKKRRVSQPPPHQGEG